MVKGKFSDRNTIIVVITTIVISLLIATFLSPFASTFPDGLEKIAERLGFAEKATEVVSSKFFINFNSGFSYCFNFRHGIVEWFERNLFSKDNDFINFFHVQVSFFDKGSVKNWPACNSEQDIPEII